MIKTYYSLHKIMEVSFLGKNKNSFDKVLMY